MKSIGSRRKIVETINDSAIPAPVHVARVVVGVILKKIFRILIANVSDKPVHVLKHMIVAYVTNGPGHIIATETALLAARSEIIGAARYKPSVNRDNQMTRGKGVKAKDDHNR